MELQIRQPIESSARLSGNLSDPIFIAVVIPFFQREEGVLGRALGSIVRQSIDLKNTEVIVVDDGSPISAKTEVASFEALFPNCVSIRILEQVNAGPNTARNTALANLSVGTELVAFLDSDDTWSEDHLGRAAHALLSTTRANAYFSNLRHLGADGPAEFERAKRISLIEHPLIFEGDPSLRFYQGDMIDQIMRANTIFMPTLVLKKELFGVRFDDGFRHGGGDYIYWLKLIAGGARFCLSTNVEVECGSGINMWYSNGWGTDGYLKRLAGESAFRKRALNLYISEPRTKALVIAQLKRIRQTVILDSIHRIVRLKPLRLKELLSYRAEFGLGLSDVFSAIASKISPQKSAIE